MLSVFLQNTCRPVHCRKVVGSCCSKKTLVQGTELASNPLNFYRVITIACSFFAILSSG
jgi:hypothetical protein